MEYGYSYFTLIHYRKDLIKENELNNHKCSLHS